MIFQICEQTDYREFLKTRLNDLKRSLGRRYQLTQLASHTGIQRTYLSKVLNGAAHLSEDQLYLMMTYLKLNEREQEVVTLRFQMQKTGLEKRRLELKHLLQKKIKEYELADKHLEIKKVSSKQQEERLNKYFVNPYVQLVHIFLTLPQFQGNPGVIAQVLKLSNRQVDEIINELMSMGLVELRAHRLLARQESFFLTARSDLAKTYHALAKQTAATRVFALAPEHKNSFTTVFTCSVKGWRQIRLQVADLLRQLETFVTTCDEPTDVFQMSLDLFPWTNPEVIDET